MAIPSQIFISNPPGQVIHLRQKLYYGQISEILHRESSFCNDYFLLKFENDRGWRGMVEAVREFSLEFFPSKFPGWVFFGIYAVRSFSQNRKVPRPLLSEQNRKSFNDLNNKLTMDNQWEIKSKKHLAIKNTLIKILVSYITVSYEERSVERGEIP